MSKNPHILVVDDEASIRKTLTALLSRAGYDVAVAENGKVAIERLERSAFDLLICDLKMPGVDGLEVIRTAQQRDPELAIIVLTGHGDLESAIEGLRRGIFDYLLKTTPPEEVLERVAAGLEHRNHDQRRRQLLHSLLVAAAELQEEIATDSATSTEILPADQETLVVGPLRIDLLHQEVELDGRKVILTPTELRVLTCLAHHAGTMLSYSQLVRCAQGYDAKPTQAAELIKPHLHHLRQKLEHNPAHPRYLLNVRGSGYMLSFEESDNHFAEQPEDLARLEPAMS
jgi:DNA-binding response OmpR family regulator